MCSHPTGDVVSKFSFFAFDGRSRILEAQKLTDPDLDFCQFLKCLIPRGILCSLTTDDVVSKFTFLLVDGRIRILEVPKLTDHMDLSLDPDPEHC